MVNCTETSTTRTIAKLQPTNPTVLPSVSGGSIAPGTHLYKRHPTRQRSRYRTHHPQAKSQGPGVEGELRHQQPQQWSDEKDGHQPVSNLICSAHRTQYKSSTKEIWVAHAQRTVPGPATVLWPRTVLVARLCSMSLADSTDKAELLKSESTAQR